MTTSIRDTVELANGVRMPWLGLGVWKVTEEQDVVRAIHAATAAGYRSIDTAAVYANEQFVGRAIRDCGVARDELFITTKVWNDDHGYDNALRAFETSLGKLDTDYVDLLLIHWPGKDRYPETWRALEKLYRDGRVRAIGVSNFHVVHLERLAQTMEIAPMVNQVEYHPLLTQKELLGHCREHGIRLEAWSPLMRGSLDLDVLADIAAKHGKTAAQVVLRWDLQHGVVTIPKSITPARIQENAAIFDFALSGEDMARIDALNRDHRFGTNPETLLF